jgi:integrase
LAVLTAAAVARLRPKAGRYEVPDGGVGGLYLLIQPTGKKSWVMRYRRPGSKTGMVKLTLGTADLSGKEEDQEPKIGGHLTLAGARALAAQVNRQRALGRDPAEGVRASKEARREIRTFAEAARTFIEEHSRPKVRRWKEQAKILGIGADDEMALARGGVAHRWRDTPIDSITGDDIFRAVDEARRRGVPGVASRGGASEARARHVASCLSVMFGWLARNRIIKTNPCAGLARPKAAPARERVLSDDEVRWLWRACDDAGEPFGPMVKLLLITGARLRECAEMTRSELEGPTWTIPGSRTKNKRTHTVPMPPMATEIITGVRVIAGEAGYIFTTTGKTPVSGFNHAKAAIDRAMLTAARDEAIDDGEDPAKVTIAPWRLHDLRRTAITGMARAGADLYAIERTVNHISGTFSGVVAIYQRHKFEAEKKVALEAWAKLLSSIVGELAPNVVPLLARA